MITQEQFNKLEVGDTLISKKGTERKITKISGSFIYFKSDRASGGFACYVFSDISKTYSLKERYSISSKGQAFLVKDNVYNRHTMFSVAQSQEEFETSYKEIFNQEECMPLEHYQSFFESPTKAGRTIFKYNVCIIILKTADIPYITHEIFHATEAHFEKIGLPHSDTSSEAWAYYLQFLMENFIKNYKK